MGFTRAVTRAKPTEALEIERDVTVANRHRRLRLPRGGVERLIAVLDADGRWPVPEGELSIVFVTDPELARIHEEFLDDPTVTDVITFEGDPLCGSAGEICVSADRAAEVASERGDPFSRELALYIVHGYLHLAGFDDLEPAKKRVMRRAESAALTALQRAGALPEFALALPPKRAAKAAAKPAKRAKTSAKGGSARGR